MLPGLLVQDRRLDCHVNESGCSGNRGDLLLVHVGLGDQLLATSDSLRLQDVHLTPSSHSLAREGEQWVFVADTVAADDALQPSERTRQSVNGQAAVDVHHNQGRHLTLSLAVLSSVLGFLLGWDFANNVYAQHWVAQNLAEVGLIAFAVIMGVVLLPLAMILLMGFMGREKKSAAGQYSSNRSKKN